MVISGRDPRLIEGVVSSILHLLQVQGVSKEAAYSTLHKMVQVQCIVCVNMIDRGSHIIFPSLQDHHSILLLLLTKVNSLQTFP